MIRLNEFGSAIIVFVVAVVVVGAVGLVVLRHKPAHRITNPHSCVMQTFSSGNGGKCVKDIQTMVNPQAYGIDGQLYIKVSGAYDAATVSAVKTFQKNVHLAQSGSISPSDWKQLCHTGEPSSAFTAAAKDAGC